MAINHLLSFLLFLLTLKTGFSAEISKFVQTGASVQLDLQTQQLPEFEDFFWIKDASENIVKYNEFKKVKAYTSYQNRTEFNETNFSLTLKNMQKTDSGRYTARISGDLIKYVVVYRVSVIDAVKSPVLTVNSNSSDFCTVNVTCRAQDLIIDSYYQNNRCFPEEVTSLVNYTLNLSCSETSIICNYSNPVSWKKEEIEIRPHCGKKEGFSAEISVFVQTGASVQLDIQTTQLPEFEHLYWTDKESKTIVKYNYKDKEVTFYNSYNDIVIFNDTSFSLTLKKTEKTDSGLYTASISGGFTKDILKYKVSVIDEVEAPVLSVNSNCSSSELSNFTCSGRGVIISSIYNSSSCSEEEVTSADDHTLRLNCNNTFIVCNYSNPVSWKTDIKKVDELCNINPVKRISSKPAAFPLWLIAVIVLVALGLLVATGFCFYKKRRGYAVSAQMNIPTTVYENVDENKTAQKSLEVLEKTENPVTIYHTIGETPHLPIQTNHTTHNDTTPDQTQTSVTENSKSAGPVTIYCTIEKQPDQPKPETDNTIYAVVKKPIPGFESPKLH